MGDKPSQDKPKVKKTQLFLNALQGIKNNPRSPVFVAPDVSRKDIISDKCKSEKEIPPTVSEEIGATFAGDKCKFEKEIPFTAVEKISTNYSDAENKSEKDIQSNKFPHKNSKASSGNSIDFEEQSCSVTVKFNEQSELISRSVSCPTSNQNNYAAPSDKEYSRPCQIRSQRHNEVDDSRTKNHSFENKLGKYSSNSIRYDNTDKGGISTRRYHRSYSEADHSKKFSESCKEPLLCRKREQSKNSLYPSNKFKSESSKYRCNLANEESNVNNFINRDKTRNNYQSKSLVLESIPNNNLISESSSETLDTWANWKDPNFDVQHLAHKDRNVKIEQPKLPSASTSNCNYKFKSERFPETGDNWIDQEHNSEYLVSKNTHAKNEQTESFVSPSNYSNSFKSENFPETRKNWICQGTDYKFVDKRNVQTKFEKSVVRPNNFEFRNDFKAGNRCTSKESDVPFSIHENRHGQSSFNCNLKMSSVLPELVKCKVEDTTEYSNLEFIQDTTTNFIPPPVLPSLIKEDANQINSACGTISDQNGISSNNIDSNSADLNINKDICIPEPDSKQLEDITQYILGIVKEKSVSHSLADRVVRHLNMLFKNHLEGNIIDVYGSYYSNLAISTSDINLVMKSDTSVKKDFMFQVYKVISQEQFDYNVHPFEEQRSASQTKIVFSEPKSGVRCELAYLGRQQESTLRMGKFLRNVSMYNQKARTLIIAAKIWAEMCLINDVEEGRLHPIGFSILVIHFLQHCEKPILPIPIEFLPNNKLESPCHPPNSSSVGELWVAFLKYFTITFCWSDNVVTVTSKETVSKKSKKWDNVWMAIEDPFSGQNIAKNVINSDTAEFIKASFKSSYEYFCSSVDSSSSDSTDESYQESPFGKWQYSFDQCMADQSDLLCDMCDDLGDTCDECKMKICTPTLSPVPKMTDDFLKKIRQALDYVYDKYMLTDDELLERKEFVEKLQKDIRKISYGYRDAELNLFGSSINGFGFKHGDLDMCLTLKGKQIENPTTILKDLRTLLRRNKHDFDFSIAIFTATVPIVQFHYKPKGWRGDICVNNTLAVYNSRLLHTYTLIDERCKILGCALRLLAKKAMITEVTNKALSSYAYSIMVIHFLQQVDPPVLPVLQDPELHQNDYKLTDIVENCNVWFYADIDKLKCSTNDTPVEQLWLDLLEFYCSYDNNRFITIQQKEPLLLSDKKIKASLFNIQDPFIHDKNLGRVVSYGMAQKTEKVFLRARNLFRTPKDLPPGVKDIEDFFFSTRSLTGRIHKEAHCDLCGKYGHENKECKKMCFPMFRRPRFTSRNYCGKLTPKFKTHTNSLYRH